MEGPDLTAAEDLLERAATYQIVCVLANTRTGSLTKLVSSGLLAFTHDKDGVEYYQITERGRERARDTQGDEREGPAPPTPDAVLQPPPVLGEPAPADLLSGVRDQHLPADQVGGVYTGGEPGVAAGGGSNGEVDGAAAV